jgi:hypothetical protein
MSGFLGRRVVVVGAGIGGLSIAGALAKGNVKRRAASAPLLSGLGAARAISARRSPRNPVSCASTLWLGQLVFRIDGPQILQRVRGKPPGLRRVPLRSQAEQRDGNAAEFVCQQIL